jgi:hypothetical protein
LTQGGLLLNPKKRRFENSTNKKTLKQTWRFFLLRGLFVTQAFGSSNYIKDKEQILICLSLIK